MNLTTGTKLILEDGTTRTVVGLEIDGILTKRQTLNLVIEDDDGAIFTYTLSKEASLLDQPLSHTLGENFTLYNDSDTGRAQDEKFIRLAMSRIFSEGHHDDWLDDYIDLTNDEAKEGLVPCERYQDEKSYELLSEVHGLIWLLKESG